MAYTSASQSPAVNHRAELTDLRAGFGAPFSSPRLHDSSSDQIAAQGEVSDQAETLDAGVMMCLELLRLARRIRGTGAR